MLDDDYRDPHTQRTAFHDWQREQEQKYRQPGPDEIKIALEYDTDIVIERENTDIIKNVIGRRTIGMIYGSSTAGKTFAVLDMGYALALELPEGWVRQIYGESARQTPMLYIGLEGEEGLKRRIALACKVHGSAKKWFARLLTYVTLNSKDGAFGIAVIIAHANHMRKETGVAPIIVIDTLSRAIVGDEEQSNKDMGLVLDRCRQIRDATDSTIIIVHHAGKDTSGGPRGASTLKGNIDFLLRVDRPKPKLDENGLPIPSDEPEVRTLYAEKVKDGEERLLCSFRLKRGELDIDTQGDPITSCTVEKIDEPTMATKKKAERTPPTRDQQLVLDRIHEMVGSGRCVTLGFADEAPEGAKAVANVDLQEEWALHTHQTPWEELAKAFRNNFSAHKSKLKANGHLGSNKTHLWAITRDFATAQSVDGSDHRKKAN